MCGRFYLDVPKDHLIEQFHLDDTPAPRPRFNIAPSQDIAAVRQAERDREIVMLHWGLVPAWSREAKPSYSLINARAETVATKPTFRRRRCLIPASGFYSVMWTCQV